MKVMSDDLFKKLVSMVPASELAKMLETGDLSVNDIRSAAGLGDLFQFVPLPPPDHGCEWRGAIKWPWFTARRRGYLLQQRVDDFEARLAHLEDFHRGPPLSSRKK